jgi:ribosomal protein S18 acetylase RimI-like enzyme
MIRDLTTNVINLNVDLIYLEEDGVMVGSLMLLKHQDFIWVHSLEIWKQHRGKGYGRRLIETTTRYAEGKPLRLSCDEDNFVAVTMYEKMGFRKIESSNGYCVYEYK